MTEEEAYEYLCQQYSLETILSDPEWAEDMIRYLQEYYPSEKDKYNLTR